MSADELRQKQSEAVRREWEEFPRRVKEALSSVPAHGYRYVDLPVGMREDEPLLKKVIADAEKGGWTAEVIGNDVKFSVPLEKD